MNNGSIVFRFNNHNYKYNCHLCNTHDDHMYAMKIYKIRTMDITLCEKCAREMAHYLLNAIEGNIALDDDQEYEGALV